MTFPGKSNLVKARQTFSSSASFEHDGCVSVLALIAVVSLDHEENRLIQGPLSLHSYTQGFPVEYELDELIPPQTIQLLHSWTTFKETMMPLSGANIFSIQ